jgi:hypothetical protein
MQFSLRAGSVFRVVGAVIGVVVLVIGIVLHKMLLDIVGVAWALWSAAVYYRGRYSRGRNGGGSRQ